MKKIFLLLFIGFAFSNCEKDDICDETTPKTPRVVIEFYDFAQQSLVKNISNLKVVAVGQIDSLAVFNAVSKIQLPLNASGTSTKYGLTLNSSIPASANEDFLEFKYSTNTLYVSRACGFKITYDLDENNPIVHTDATSLDGKWIKDIDIITTNIDDEKTTHVKIYF